MNFEPPIDDSYLREDRCDFLDEMDRIRDEVMKNLSPIEIAALFNDYERFMELYVMEER